MSAGPVAGMVLVLALATAVRLQPWNDVFLPGKAGAAFLGDTDPYYHALRAERIAARYPAVPWRDDAMNFPDGADILWPPLFDHMIATGAYVFGAGHPSRPDIERVAAVVPPALGVATVGVVAWLGRVFLPGSWLGPGLLFALLPAHTEFSVVGRADQHVAELLLQVVTMLAMAAAWQAGPWDPRRWGWMVVLGVALALSFWNWQGSALYLIILAACVAAWHVCDAQGEVARGGAAVLAGGTGLGGVLLVVSLVLWGRSGGVLGLSLSGVSAIQPLLTGLVSLFALGLWCGLRLRKPGTTTGRRALEVLIAGLVPLAAALILLPGLRAGVDQGLRALTAGNPWYSSIREFQPLLFGGAGIGHELQAWVPRFFPLFVMPLAAPALRRIWRDHPDRRAAVMVLGVWGMLLLLVTLARMRFVLYLSVPAVLWTWIALRDLAASLHRRVGRPWTGPAVLAAGLAVVLLPAVFYFSHGGLRRDPKQVEVRAALEWLRDTPVTDSTRTAVFSEWDWGHLIQYFASRPSVATPFGTDGGPGAIEDTAAFFLTASATEAIGVLERRRAGYVLIVDPLTQASEAAPFGLPGTLRPVTTTWHWLAGPRMFVTPAVDDLVAVRIYYDSGLSARGLPSIDRFRLVYEGSPAGHWQVRLFEFVRGASVLVQGAGPGSRVRIAVGYRTNRARAGTWYATAEADGQGQARVRVPYATGANGVVTAGAYLVTSDDRQVTVTISPTAVERGETALATLRQS